jgi:prepilin-type N-terminal cleavage/methylation domain-containing protein
MWCATLTMTLVSRSPAHNHRIIEFMKAALQSGFTLIEMAIVLMIVGLLLGGLLVPLTAQMDQRNSIDTQKTLAEIKDALIGFAIANGRLPCPASSTSNGVESPVGGGNCSNFYDGFVPAATLGITSAVDNQGNTGFAIDAWGNRIRYAVTSANSNAFTTANGMSTTGIASLAPNLLVCSTASTTGSGCSVANSTLTSSPGVPAVIFSTGKTTGTGTDEGDNTDNDRVFVSHTPTPTFDDIVVWISPNILFNRMVTAGQLP